MCHVDAIQTSLSASTRWPLLHGDQFNSDSVRSISAHEHARLRNKTGRSAGGRCVRDRVVRGLAAEESVRLRF